MVVYTDSAEVIEQRYPILIRSVRLLADSGGPGQFRGAPATEVEYGPRFGPVTVYFFADFASHPAQGVWGGQPGSVASVTHVTADGREVPLPPIGDITLRPGEWLRGCEAGGGGYGDPMTRNPISVLADVKEGWITPPAATASYGVALVKTPSGWALDPAARARLATSTGDSKPDPQHDARRPDGQAPHHSVNNQPPGEWQPPG